MNHSLQRPSSDIVTPVLEGFLLKKGAKGINLGWKRRWFSLKNERLYYFTSADANVGTERGFIDLQGEYTIEHNKDVDHAHFRIKTPLRVWQLLAEDEEECRFWVEGLISFKRRQQRIRKLAFYNSASFRKLEKDTKYSEEHIVELEKLLEEAEEEVFLKQNTIDEIQNDLQNSIRLLKLKGDQLEKLDEKCKEREKIIMELQEENKKLLEKSKSSNIEKKGELECDETLDEDIKKKNKHQKSKIKKSSKSIHHAAAGSDSQGKTDREVQLEGLVEQMNLMLVKTEQRTVKYKNDSQLLQILVAGMANYLSVPQAKSEQLELPNHLVQSFPPGTPGDGKLTIQQWLSWLNEHNLVKNS